MSGVYELTRSIDLPRPLDEVFAFFADAQNLQRLTPPWVSFRILSPLPITMCPGALIDYRIAIRGMPMRWQSEITVWDPPHRFVDEQRRGPYRQWQHEHRFEAIDTGTRVIDQVTYQLRGGAWLGAIAHRLFVRRDVQAIFAYRHDQLSAIFDPPNHKAGRDHV